MSSPTITHQQWTFLQTVARAAFANPFGETRDDLDLVIGGAAIGSSAEETLRAALLRVDETLGELRRKGLADLRRHEGGRKEVLRTVFLFQLFHRHLEDFDRLIQSQLFKGDTPSPVPFAAELLKRLGQSGFDDQESLRYIAVFYQLRRAFYFISNGLVGTSPGMRALRKHLWNCLFTHDMRWFESHLWNRMEDFSILLLGETGTGKGAAAAAIGHSGFIPFDPGSHRFSESFTRNFVAINLSQYSEGVLESELFGHRKGAFTGAVQQHEGLFSRCAPHGVIFLDEIGDIGIPVQIKLLQVLQERIFYPVGSHEAKRFSGRIVAATNRPLDELRAAGKFRDDLFYRLCSDIVTLPPLRLRLEEEPAELDHLLDSILLRLTGEAAVAEKKLVKSALKRDLGRDYPWPGNVRELEQALKRIILTGGYHGIAAGGKAAGGEVREAVERVAVGMEAGTLSAERLLAHYCALLYRQFGTYEEVSRRTELDRRTVKKYVRAETEGA